jgi:putative Mg2+ transporter-C (MgtC) family protein
MVDEGELLLRVAAAAVLAGAVGSDREAANKPAGIRTRMLVGAGAALQSGERVTGRTTAAGIWVVAAIGLLVGSGFWIIGVGGTVLVLPIVNDTALASMVWGASSLPEE